MTAKEFLKLHFPQPDDLVNGDFRELFERKMDEFAQIKFREIENWLLVNTDLDVKKIVDLKIKFNKPKF